MSGDFIYNWLSLDIETADGRPEDLERWMRLQWKPAPSWKAETIGQRYLQLYERKSKKLALLDESPIIVIAVQSNTELRALHCCYEHPAKLIHGALAEGFESAAAMLAALRNLMDGHMGPDTVLLGHNLKRFDAPKLRWAYCRQAMRLPEPLLNRDQPIFDTMVEYQRRFTINKGDIMIALDDLLEDLGLPSHKGTASGAMIPQLYAQKEYETIIKYALLDVIAQSDVFLRMTGQSPEAPTEP